MNIQPLNELVLKRKKRLGLNPPESPYTALPRQVITITIVAALAVS